MTGRIRVAENCMSCTHEITFAHACVDLQYSTLSGMAHAPQTVPGIITLKRIYDRVWFVCVRAGVRVLIWITSNRAHMHVTRSTQHIVKLVWHLIWLSSVYTMFIIPDRTKKNKQHAGAGSHTAMKKTARTRKSIDGTQLN